MNVKYMGSCCKRDWLKKQVPHKKLLLAGGERKALLLSITARDAASFFKKYFSICSSSILDALHQEHFQDHLSQTAISMYLYVQANLR
jgi:hypothetical protein